jgi:hypothetical protein
MNRTPVEAKATLNVIVQTCFVILSDAKAEVHSIIRLIRFDLKRDPSSALRTSL